MSILIDAAEVARGARPPTHSAAAYRAAALGWAERVADEDESPTVSLARLCATGSPIVRDLYRAASIAHALDTLDLGELVPTEAHQADNRLATWTALLDLAAPHRLPNETLSAAVRRLLGENLAARALFILILQEPRQ